MSECSPRAFPLLQHGIQVYSGATAALPTAFLYGCPGTDVMRSVEGRTISIRGSPSLRHGVSISPTVDALNTPARILIRVCLSSPVSAQPCPSSEKLGNEVDGDISTELRQLQQLRRHTALNTKIRWACCTCRQGQVSAGPGDDLVEAGSPFS